MAYPNFSSWSNPHSFILSSCVFPVLTKYLIWTESETHLFRSNSSLANFFISYWVPLGSLFAVRTMSRHKAMTR